MELFPFWASLARQNQPSKFFEQLAITQGIEVGQKSLRVQMRIVPRRLLQLVGPRTRHFGPNRSQSRLSRIVWHEQIEVVLDRMTEREVAYIVKESPESREHGSLRDLLAVDDLPERILGRAGPSDRLWLCCLLFLRFPSREVLPFGE
jgi:hypothetical protein